MAKVEIYTKDYCPYCKRTKATLTDLGVSFENYEITDNEPMRQQMIARSKRKTVPQIFINDHHVGGNDDLHTALKNGTLKKLLQK
ncbi:glutaredoxin 3 [Shewanella sp. 202IG2-18]|uniref:glutaredoxin 3 n=1 Tax=Parashewanella hymeniacidonis TaxID=2807618 RepID=UPI001961737C|nr:glutaredoxin 3 [Parashewanella hymeniacidonis]MBM7073201.1 glutaredoxin 3 [Parashewanella hymeniacidonis]